MYINKISHYIPDLRLDNFYFSQKTGLTPEDLYKKAGINTRSKCSAGENSNTMSIKAIENCRGDYPFPLEETDLIIGASYSPYDTVGTIAHAVQKHFQISGCKALQVSSACSSYVNAIEIIQGYYATSHIDFSLVLATENNSAYNDESDPQSGHLWGDAATATFISREKIGSKSLMIIDVMSEGLGHVGFGPDAVYMRPLDGGVKMPAGRDVFINAIQFMTMYVKNIVTKNGFSMDDLSYVVPHQANTRIIYQIASNLNYNKEKILINIDKYGNTGCASTPLVLSENWEDFQFGDLIALTVFGGGYSAGAMLLRVV